MTEATLELVHLRASQINGCSYCSGSGGSRSDEHRFQAELESRRRLIWTPTLRALEVREDISWTFCNDMRSGLYSRSATLPGMDCQRSRGDRALKIHECVTDIGRFVRPHAQPPTDQL
jgi:hypothetical protein